MSPSSRFEMSFLGVSNLNYDNATLPRKVGVRMSVTQPYIQGENILDYHLFVKREHNLDRHMFKERSEKETTVTR